MIPQQHTYTRQGATYLTPEYFQFLRDHELLIDVSAGGLIIGPTKAEGGITLMGCNENVEFFVAGQLEGYQFLVNDFARFENEDKLNQLSRHLLAADQLFIPYVVPSPINVLVVAPKEVEGQLLTPVLYYSTRHMCVMPRVPAQKNLSFLDTINRDAWLRHVTEKQPPGKIRESARLAKLSPSSQN